MDIVAHPILAGIGSFLLLAFASYCVGEGGEILGQKYDASVIGGLLIAWLNTGMSFSWSTLRELAWMANLTKLFCSLFLLGQLALPSHSKSLTLLFTLIWRVFYLAPETIFFISALRANNPRFAIGAVSGSTIGSYSVINLPFILL